MPVFWVRESSAVCLPLLIPSGHSDCVRHWESCRCVTWMCKYILSLAFLLGVSRQGGFLHWIANLLVIVLKNADIVHSYWHHLPGPQLHACMCMILCVCLCVWGYACHSMCVEIRGNFVESFFSSHLYMCSGDWTGFSRRVQQAPSLPAEASCQPLSHPYGRLLVSLLLSCGCSLQPLAVPTMRHRLCN